MSWLADGNLVKPFGMEAGACPPRVETAWRNPDSRPDLAGTPCQPHKQVLIGGRKPWSAGAEGARALGRDPDRIRHLRSTLGLFSRG